MLSRLERLLAELKRRNVLRMAGLYAVGAWVVVQVAATTFPYLGLPAWAVTAVIILAMIGMPITLLLAWSYELTDAGVQRETSSSDPATSPDQVAPRRRRHVAVAAIVIALIALGGFAAIIRARVPDVATLDGDLAVVTPFRVTGGDASAAALGEGMVDLLALRLASEAGVRAVDSRSAIAAWKRAGGEHAADPNAAASAAARALGAGRAIVGGSVVVSGNNVTIGASVLRTDRPFARPKPARVEGSLDSLLVLVDRLTVALLARDAGLDEHRLSDLTSLAAVQAFLAGKSAHRRGQYREAVAHYQKALQVDSTFALAAVALNLSARRSTEQFALTEPAVALAHKHRDKLSDHDRALLHALNPRYPAVPTILQVINAFDEMLGTWSDDADAWFEYGDLLLHWGRLSGIDDAVAQSELAFHRALALDSSFYLPAEHLLIAALELQKRDLVQQLLQHLSAIGGVAARMDFVNWRAGLALGDSARVRAVSARLDSLDAISRGAIAGEAQWLGERLDDAERAIAIAVARAATTAEQRSALIREHDLAINRGMLRRAQAALERAPLPPLRRDFSYIADALFADGEHAAAEAAAVRLRGLLAKPRGADTLPGWQRASVECQLAWWDLAQEREDSAAARRQRLRTEDTNTEHLFNVDDVLYCRTLIDAALAVSRRSVEASALLERADSLNIHSATGVYEEGNMITARLHERLGNIREALALWRRVRIGTPDISSGTIATRHHETARLALLVGDRALARDYYRRYLALRSNADAALQPAVARARAALAELSAEPRR